MVRNHLKDLKFDCYENVQIRDYHERFELEDILAGIYCNKNIQSLIQSVREGTESKEDILPVFIPSQFNGKPTGIVQLDYDTIKKIENSEEMKRQLEKNIPSLIYAFISPSGGLKAGVLTDFYGADAENEKFKHAVEAVEDEVRMLINNPDIIFDHHSKTLNQPCFFSYDENLVYNSDPDELPVKEKAQQLFLEEQESQKDRIESIRHIYPIDNDEVKSAFLAIPPDLNSKRLRNKINTAVLNVFGSEGINLILDHWIFKKKTKAIDSVNRLYQKTLQHQGNTVGIKFIIQEAKSHGWKNTTWKGRKSTGLEGREPTYTGKLYPKVDDAVERMQDVIEHYFKTGDDTQLYAECGLGKTRQTLMKIAQIENTVAYFIPEHETANQIENSLIEFGVPPEDIIRIQGYSRTCRKIEHLKEEEKVGLFQNWNTCLSCGYFNRGCDYHEQFKGNQRIRIYPHASLFSPSSSEKFKPDFVIVDESITENICEINHYKRNSGNIFKKLIKAETIEVGEIDAELKKLNKLFRPQERQLIPPPTFNFDSDIWKEKLKKNKATSSTYTKIKHLEEYKKKIEGKHTDYMIWSRNGRVYFGKKKQINSRWHSKPILYLDASGDKKITEIVFEEEFKVYEKIRCEYADGVRVIQIFDKLFSKNQCSEDSTYNDLEWLVSMLGDSDNIGFIGYKNITEQSDENKKPKKVPFISKLIPEKYHHRILHYGGLRGKNKIEDAGCDTLLDIGSHRLSDDGLIDIGHVLFREDDLVKDIASVKKTYRMADGNHISAIFTEYSDERLQVLSEVFNKSENYQAGHRVRLLHKPNRTLILLSNEVLDFTVDELITVEQIIPASNKRRKLIEAVKKNDGEIPVKKNKIIMEKTGLNEAQVKSMKKDKNWINRNFWFHVNSDGMFRFIPCFGDEDGNGIDGSDVKNSGVDGVEVDI